MATISGVTVTKPTDAQITAWWKWATSFSKNTSPFEKGWENASDRNDRSQPRTGSVFCISCTGGQGGEDNAIRPLDAAKKSGKDILVPVFVAYGESESEAKKLLGKSSYVHFLVNGNPREAFYKETDVGSVNFAVDNSFDEDSGSKSIYSAGYWAKVSLRNLKNIQFGGMGGQINPNDQREYQTLVTYGLTK